MDIKKQKTNNIVKNFLILRMIILGCEVKGLGWKGLYIDISE